MKIPDKSTIRNKVFEAAKLAKEVKDEAQSIKDRTPNDIIEGVNQSPVTVERVSLGNTQSER
jgi:hypothetical protein